MLIILSETEDYLPGSMAAIASAFAILLLHSQERHLGIQVVGRATVVPQSTAGVLCHV